MSERGVHVVDLHITTTLTFNWTRGREMREKKEEGRRDRNRMELINQSDDDNDEDNACVCMCVFRLTWYQVGRGFFFSICTHCATRKRAGTEKDCYDGCSSSAVKTKYINTQWAVLFFLLD